jgi:hypothetical protein
MDKFFCADHSRYLGELPIATAPQVRTYVLIECPFPWSAKGVTDPAMPAALGQVMRQISQQHQAVKFLLVNRASTKLLGCRSVIIYQQKAEIFCDGYDRVEFAVNGLAAAAVSITQFFDQGGSAISLASPQQDVLICTHGSHDQCCARYGKPFYLAAAKLVQANEQVQVWCSSHFGGHRFAPTAITFPDGRYYARLTIDGLQAILLRQMDRTVVRSMYRGWGILPPALQVVEQQLLERLGDRGYGLAMRYEILASAADQTKIMALVTWMEHRELISCYCEVSLDPAASISLQASCHADEASICRKYHVDRLEVRPLKQTTLV